jgi:hypothetical protein
MNANISMLTEQATSRSWISGLGTHVTVDQTLFTQLVVQQCMQFVQDDQGSGHQLAQRMADYFDLDVIA